LLVRQLVKDVRRVGARCEPADRHDVACYLGHVADSVVLKPGRDVAAYRRVWKERFTFPDLRRSRSPRLDVLDDLGVELLDSGERRVDEGPVALAACGAGVAGQREGKGPQFMVGALQERLRIGTGLIEGPGRSRPRCQAVDVSTVRWGGAVFSCRTSQLMRVADLPSRGAGTVTA